MAELKPQPGPQTEFLQSRADIVVFGGSARGGKSYALLLECLRHANVPGFSAAIFRRTVPELLNPGGLFHEASKLYLPLGARRNRTSLEFTFGSGASVKLSHLQHEEDRFNWQGTQIPLLCFDELTHFSEDTFFFLLSRNGSTCGVKPYVRTTCNPDPHSWVKGFIAPWIDPTHPQAAQSAELRWFVRDGGLISWVGEGTPHAKSLTFIRSSVYDNRILLEQSPETLANLMALPPIERARMLDGDWNAVADGNLFKRSWFPFVETAPDGLKKVRFWDLAATEPKPGRRSDPDYTAGVLMGKAPDGLCYVLDVKRERATPAVIERLVRRTAEEDGKAVPIWMEQEGGSSGKIVVDHYGRNVLPDFELRAARSTTDKKTRAKPLSAQAERGNISLLRASWNDAFLNELAAFPSPYVHDDQVDAASGACNQLNERKAIRFV